MNSRVPEIATITMIQFQVWRNRAEHRGSLARPGLRVGDVRSVLSPTVVCPIAPEAKASSGSNNVSNYNLPCVPHHLSRAARGAAPLRDDRRGAGGAVVIEQRTGPHFLFCESESTSKQSPSKNSGPVLRFPEEMEAKKD